MTQKELQLKTFEESLNYYLTIDEEGEVVKFTKNVGDLFGCMYKAINDVTTEGCLVGRLLKPETRHVIDKKFSMGMDIVSLTYRYSCLSENNESGKDSVNDLIDIVNKYGIKFLNMLQQFHDNTKWEGNFVITSIFNQYTNIFDTYNMKKAITEIKLLIEKGEYLDD